MMSHSTFNLKLVVYKVFLCVSCSFLEGYNTTTMIVVGWSAVVRIRFPKLLDHIHMLLELGKFPLDRVP